MTRVGAIGAYRLGFYETILERGPFAKIWMPQVFRRYGAAAKRKCIAAERKILAEIRRLQLDKAKLSGLNALTIRSARYETIEFENAQTAREFAGLMPRFRLRNRKTKGLLASRYGECASEVHYELGVFVGYYQGQPEEPIETSVRGVLCKRLDKVFKLFVSCTKSMLGGDDIANGMARMWTKEVQPRGCSQAALARLAATAQRLYR